MCLHKSCIRKKTMEIYNISKWDSSGRVDICSPPSSCSLLHSLSLKTLTTWPMWSPLTGFLPPPLEKHSSSCTEERASNYNRKSKPAGSPGSWARREQHTKHVRTLSMDSVISPLHWSWLMCLNQALNTTAGGKKLQILQINVVFLFRWLFFFFFGEQRCVKDPLITCFIPLLLGMFFISCCTLQSMSILSGLSPFREKKKQYKL